MRRTDQIVIASYNVHSCVGSDGRRDPHRIAAVIDELDADVVGLQELDYYAHGDGRLDQLAVLARASGYVWLGAPTVHRRDGFFGNGLLTRVPVRRVAYLDLSLPGREPRGAIEVELDQPGARIRVVATHLGLRPFERGTQCDWLLDRLAPESEYDLSVLLGDFNEWWAPGRILARVHRCFGRARGVRSFPASAPILALDRIWVKPPAALKDFRAHRSPLARRASDHLPVRAVIELPKALEPREGDPDVVARYAVSE